MSQLPEKQAAISLRVGYAFSGFPVDELPDASAREVS
jgi:hypothetical protein